MELPYDPGPRVRRAWAIPLFLLLVALPLLAATPSLGQGDPPDATHPIIITDDEMMDVYFAGQGTDGLTPGTAYVLEGVGANIQLTSSDDAFIDINGTTRYLVIKDCTLEGPGLPGSVGIRLDSCSNVTVMDCDISDTATGIEVVGCHDVVISGNVIKDHSSAGVHIAGSQHCTVRGNSIERSNDSIDVTRGVNLTFEDNKVYLGRKGFKATQSWNVTVSGNVFSKSADTGFKLLGCVGFSVTNNLMENNYPEGVYLANSKDINLASNTMRDNTRGVYLYGCDGCTVSRNKVTGSASLGMRLSNSDGNVIEDNELRSNWKYGIDLVDSKDNEIRDNRIVSHERGVRFDRSTDNVLEGNDILASWWVGIDGDAGGNTVRDNELRANGWARGLIFLIVGLVVLGTVLGVRGWARRRRKAKDEEGVILVRQRFPSGAKGLWPMSRVMWDEDFFKAQLATAGPQREDILRRYSENIAAAKQMQYMAVGTMSAMLAFMAALPLAGLLNLVTVDITPDNVNEVLFASAIGTSVYYIMTFVILLVFGLLFTSQLMQGQIFKLLSTLPIEPRHARRIVVYMLIRMYGAPLIVVLLAFPIGGFLLTWSPAFLVTALAVNGLYLVFVCYALVLIAEATSRRVFSATASKGATAMRFLIMAGYLIAMMMIFATMQFFVGYISGLFDAAREAGGSGEAFNIVTSLVPFPFSGAYLLSVSLLPFGEVPGAVLASTMAGVLLMAGIVYGIRGRANRMLYRVARGVEPVASSTKQVTEAKDVVVRTRSPMPAFFRNGLLVTSRDQGAIMYIIMPLLFPMIALVPMAADTGQTSATDPIIPFVMYMGIMPFLVNMALSSGDATVGGLLGSLPFRVMDQYRAKWSTIVIITTTPVAIITLAMYDRVADPVEMAAVMLALVPLLMVLASLYLVSFSLAFGTVNGKQTFFMANIRRKFAKYVIIIVAQYGLVIVEVLGFYLLTGAGVIGFWTGIAGLWVVNLVAMVILEVSARRLFTTPSRASL